MVGAVIVRDGSLVAWGHHTRFGAPHAEIEALNRAGSAAAGSTLYVTLEPCCHHGKTPPCTDAIIAAGVTRVVAAMADPFPKVAGGGLAQLRDAQIEVEVGLEAAAAHKLNAPYLKRLFTGRPYVIAKWAMTLDGKIATATGDSAWISGTRSRALVHELRGRVDAILVGINTVLVDNPRLNARPTGPRTAVRVVVDSAGRLPLDSQLVRTLDQAPVWVALTERATPENRAALAQAGCDILAFPGFGPVPINDLLNELGRRGQTNLMVEGGSRILGAFLDAEAIDEVDVYVAPIIEGGTHLMQPVAGKGLPYMTAALRLENPVISVVDSDLRIQGTLPRSWRTPADMP